jgi:hypothetical protein
MFEITFTIQIKYAVMISSLKFMLRTGCDFRPDFCVVRKKPGEA